MLTAKDEELIALLLSDAREPVASLARKLGVSRTTVQDRLRRLEVQGLIAGYTVKLAPAHAQHGMAAMVMISVEPRRQVEVAKIVGKLIAVQSLHTVSGKFDLVAQIKTSTSENMDDVIDKIGVISGVTGIETAVILSTKVDRR